MKTSITLPPLWHVTYSVVTQESAKIGDESERGFVNQFGEHQSEREGAAMSLRSALSVCNPQEDSGRFLSEVDSRLDCDDWSDERRALHPPSNISEASYSRLKKLLKIGS